MPKCAATGSHSSGAFSYGGGIRRPTAACNDASSLSVHLREDHQACACRVAATTPRAPTDSFRATGSSASATNCRPGAPYCSQRRSLQACRCVPGPPNLGLSRQYEHLPQSGVRQPAHPPQRLRLMPVELGPFHDIAAESSTASAAVGSSSMSHELCLSSTESEHTHRSSPRSDSVSPTTKRHLLHSSHCTQQLERRHASVIEPARWPLGSHSVSGPM